MGNKTLREQFATVESSGDKIYDHKNGAYGSFGFKKTGRLTDLYKSSPELQKKYKSYNDLWDVISKGNYGDPNVEEVHKAYEGYLQKRFGNDVRKAAKFNFGSKANGQDTPDTYANKVTKSSGTSSVSSNGTPTTVPKVEFKGLADYIKPKENIMVDVDRPLTDKGRVSMTAINPKFNSFVDPSAKLKFAKQNSKGGFDYVDNLNEPSKAPTTSVINSKGYKSSLVNNAMPFISNITGAFNKPPMPSLPVFSNPLSLKRINMDNDRYVIEQGVRGADLFAENNLDAQTASAVKSFNNAQRFNQYSKVNQDERNMNTSIANEEAKTNLNLEYQNKLAMKGYRDDLNDRTMAIQRDRQANISNASDKYVALQDLNARRQEAANEETFAKAADKYGVYKRKEYSMRKNGGIISNHSAGQMVRRLNFKPF